MRDNVRIVVIGGGVGGSSIAWHLAQMGETDVLVLERHELTSGSTFHSAGLVGQLRSSLPLTRMMMHSVDTYRRLEAEGRETGRTPGWLEVGSMRIASTPERLEEIRRQHGWAKTFGLPMEFLSPSEAVGLFPLMSPRDLLGAIYLPTDGQLDPSGLTYSFIGGAKALGVEVATGVRVVDVLVEQGRVAGVVTDHGTIRCETVVAACGMYTPKVAAMAGVNVPLIPMAHQYLFTKPIDGVTPTLPSMRDPDNLVYFRREGQGLVMGGYERNPAPWSLDGVPEDFNNKLLPDDWPRFEPLLANACIRVPAMEQAEILRFINGPEAFTPDNEFILGPSDVPGFYVAAGFCAHGIAGAGGVGRVMAEWILDGTPSFDTWKMDIRRFGGQYRSQALTLARTTEVYSTYYDIHYPNEERQAGRPLRRSAAYGALAQLGCAFGEKSMWERPNWFVPNESLPGADDSLRPTGWAGQHWSPAIAGEAVACSSTAALFDESSFAKLEVSGPGSVEFLNFVCANDIDRPIGSVIYTQLCNERGGIESDLTATRLGPDRYLLVTGTAFGNHDAGWINDQLHRHAGRFADRVTVRDVTAAWSTFGLWGPASRSILQPLTRSSLANDAFPYLSSQAISIGAIPALALRVTYVGELGWEIYAPTEYGAALWDALWEAGHAHGLVAGGYRAIDALRVEKGYRVWSSDISPADTPYEAGLGFAVRLDKPAPFIGQEALRAQKAAGIARKLCCLKLADPLAVTLGSEPVRATDGRVLGRVTSGGYGYRVGASLSFAYLPVELAAAGTDVDVEVFGDWIPATVVKDPVYDPTGTRIRA